MASEITKKINNVPLLMSTRVGSTSIKTSNTGYTLSHSGNGNQDQDFTQVPSHLASVTPLPSLQKSLFSDPLIRAARKIAFSSENVRTQMDRLEGIEKEIAQICQNKPKGKIELAFGILTPEQNKIVFNKSSTSIIRR